MLVASSSDNRDVIDDGIMVPLVCLRGQMYSTRSKSASNILMGPAACLWPSLVEAVDRGESRWICSLAKPRFTNDEV